MHVNNKNITSMSEAQRINKQGKRFENQMSTKEWIFRSFHSMEIRNKQHYQQAKHTIL